MRAAIKYITVSLSFALSLTALCKDPVSGHDKECAARLSIVYEAVQAYRRAHHGEVPRALSELFPHFLHDPSVLSCPRAEATGRFTPANREIWTNAQYEGFGSYNWEFSGKLVPPAWLNGQAGVDWHRVKTALVKSPIGEHVPLVRCQIDSERMFNLSFGGDVYASGTYWEEMFIDRLPQSYAKPLLILRDQRPILSRLPQRTAALPAGVIDLAPAINACLSDPWLVGYGNECLPLSSAAATMIESKGVVFEVRGIVQTGVRDRPSSTVDGFRGRVYPERSFPIQLTARCARIHMLHATAFRAASGELVGRYEITTKDGVAREIALHAGVEIDCWRVREEIAPLATPWRTKVEGLGECALFHWTWENPHPDEEIATIRLCAAPESVASPFLVSMTVEAAQ